jgi:hypothetical protein
MTIASKRSGIRPLYSARLLGTAARSSAFLGPHRSPCQAPPRLFEFTDVKFFNILAPAGGVVARVAGVQHVSPTSSGFSFTFGDCEAPQD